MGHKLFHGQRSEIDSERMRRLLRGANILAADMYHKCLGKAKHHAATFAVPEYAEKHQITLSLYRGLDVQVGVRGYMSDGGNLSPKLMSISF